MCEAYRGPKASWEAWIGPKAEIPIAVASTHTDSLQPEQIIPEGAIAQEAVAIQVFPLPNQA